ncbi:MAG: electron transfer flavoprotein subunit alpha [Magnetococcales bacterium]|nr:electron transfer flavoprotein subunit alpha [Magnetococcales bacterium]|tara:strand:- start:290786 stop:291733 length:948 start_codon:yes stop_codon:yes gene_type:complete
MSILVIAEHDGKSLSLSFPKVMAAAKQLGEVTVLVASDNVAPIAEAAAKVEGVSKVITLETPEFKRPTAELWVENLEHLAANCTHIIAAATTYSRGALARLAARLQAPMATDVIAIKDANHFTRPIYAGAVNADIAVNNGEKPIIMSIRFSAFEAVGTQDGCAIEAGNPVPTKVLNESTKLEATGSDRPDLGAARLVVSGGRGVGSKEQFALIEKFADSLGAAVGASRAAVDAGYCPNDMQVGQTGKVVAPDVYFAVGISGAVQHLAGIKGAKTIVAINKDPNAPIFGVADFGIVGDLFAIVPELIEKIGKEKAA